MKLKRQSNDTLEIFARTGVGECHKKVLQEKAGCLNACRETGRRLPENMGFNKIKIKGRQCKMPNRLYCA